MPGTGLAGGDPSRGGRLCAGLARGLSTAAYLLCLLVAAACGGGSTQIGTPAGSASPHPGGTYNYPLLEDVASLLPWRGWENGVVSHQIYEGLVSHETRADGTIVTVPCLAESWSANRDATVWTFRLRRGVRFQSPVDREVTAADVVADYRYVADPRTGSYARYMYGMIDGTSDDGRMRSGRAFGVEAPDKYTVRFRLKHPFAAFPEVTSNVAYWIWPVEYLEKVGRRGFEQAPVGTGPFALSRRVKGVYVDLARNPDWWNAASGQPYVQSVHFQLYGSVSSELLAFQKGLVDYTWVPKGQVAASRSLPQVKSGEWKGVTLPQQAVWYLGFQWTDPVVGGDRGLALREAIDCAIDREALSASVSDGVDIPQTGVVPPVFPGWEEEQPPQAYDPARARDLYEQAGSPPLVIFVSAFDARFAATMGDALRKACAAAGIDATVRVVSWDRYMELFEKDAMPVFFTGWMSDYPSYDNFLYDMYVYPWSESSLGTGYHNPDVDRLLTLARSTTDPTSHLDLSRRAAHEIEADKPVLPLLELADYRLLSTRIAGFTEDPLYGVDAWKLWVK
jgi:ABC-type transport system substrate-binding protein